MAKMRGGIWKNARTYWAQYRYRGETIRENTGKLRADEAAEWRGKRLVERGLGTLNVSAKDVTFADLVRGLEANYVAKGNRSAPYISKALHDAFDGMRAMAITTDRVRAYEAARLT